MMNYTERETDVIVADSFKELTYKQKKLLLASTNADNPNREKFALSLIKTVGEGVYNKVSGYLADSRYRQKVTDALDGAGVTCVTIKSKNYPRLLANTPIPPLVLYARGNLELLNTRTVGVVGSRRISAAVAEESRKICERLSQSLTIVTGVADGGDLSAIKGGLASGKVICVLPFGHGASFNYNRAMLKEVERVGLSITEFPPKTPALRHTFVLRNRIIAGLAEATLVVSAGKDSGALSTARFAVDYSREVLALPYPVGAEQGAGCNNLIKHGALLCDCAEDILAVYGLAEVKARTELPPDGDDGDLDGDERAVLHLLKNEGELHAEVIAERLSLSPTEVITACSMLEIKGYLVRSGGNTFTAIKKK